MKMVIELPPIESNQDSPLAPGTVWHTFGFPEPEIFGFLYVHPGKLVSVGIFVPSWLGDPSRTAYRYLQHYIQHPALWRYLKDGTLRSWGAKSLDESGRRGEPFLAGDGYARIGEGSGSTNMLTGSGVDEAWTTGTQLAEAVVELLRAGKPFTQENLAATYETRRRAGWVEHGAREAENARNVRLSLGPRIPPTNERILSSKFGIKPEKLAELSLAAQAGGRPLHDALLSARGWPEISLDGRLLITHQDALLLGGKVQAMPGFADHVVFRNRLLCAECVEKTCIAMCSGQALTQGADGVPYFEREKCVHCGACLWNCGQSANGDRSNIDFHAGAGGLHSAEN
jgi:electron-transferring-flavoprotein dehydrogenase